MDQGKINAAIAQREELIKREKELLSELKQVEIDIEERKKEIRRMNEQIRYYKGLVKDMKREMKPSSLKDMLGSI